MNYLLIGRLLKPKGLRGELKAMFYADRIEDLKGFSRFYIRDKAGYKEIKIEKFIPGEGGLTVRVEGCDDRTKAEAIQSNDLFTDEAEIPVIKKKNSFYIKDLIGLEAFEGETLVGTVNNLMEVANRSLLVLSLPEKGELVVPFDDEFVEKVDLPEKKIRLKDLDKLK